MLPSARGATIECMEGESADTGNKGNNANGRALHAQKQGKMHTDLLGVIPNGDLIYGKLNASKSRRAIALGFCVKKRLTFLLQM